MHYAHRSVLAAASAYFNAMFTSDVVEAKRDRIVIQSLDSPTLASLLDFMYTGMWIYYFPKTRQGICQLTEGWEQYKPKVKNQSHNYHSRKVYTPEILNHQILKS